jgi:hypothetical protein
MLNELFQDHALWFSVPALLGTAIFVLRLGLMLIGGDSDGGDGGDIGGDAGGDSGDFGLDDHDSSDTAFEILSVQTISVFMMGFGWVGLGCVLGSRWPMSVGMALGFLGGVAMVWILARTLGAVRGLEGSGNINIESTLGLEGDVYAEVPAAGEGQGQVRLVIAKRQRIYNAVSGEVKIASMTRVRVVGVNDDNTLTVEPA